MKKIVSIMPYIIIFILCIFYVDVFIKILNPKPINLEYKMYFIDKKIGTYPVIGGLSYNLGDVLEAGDYNLYKRCARGTNFDEDNRIYYKGEKASFYFLDIPYQDLELKLTTVALDRPSYVEIFVSGKKIGEFSYSVDEELEYSFNISKELLDENGCLCIEFFEKNNLDSSIFLKNIRIL